MKDMMKAMQRLGIKQEKIDAEKVIISCRGKDIIINDPEVILVNFQGQKMFQISGEVEEKTKLEIKEDDVELVAEKGNVSKEKAREILEKTNGDIAKALLELRGE